MALFNKSTRALIFGGLFFIIPFFLVVVAGKQLFEILHPLGQKISSLLDLHTIFGKSSVLIVTILIIILVCYLAGMLIEKGLVRNWNTRLEKKLFVFFPSLQMLKFRLIGDKNKVINEVWQGIVFKEDNAYRIAFITDKKENHTTIYIPDAPKIDAGEVRYMINSEFEYYPITMKEAMSAIYNFGEGLNIESILANKTIK
ncbi:hypothetical protein C1T31_05455 [Hanstruepera neustonica]|uniref:DUF502 domain-containing protein n=1 Tax=Hanstruepera neustonica TaxID=1445657 RepID=A0A2K1E0K1_9FLAO|nr:hypothetical protein [Hanstruepera neustonica]PNQ73781.1 hypothetical protein C1T31_05455 [Hanstruepera neustonica]